MQANGFGVNNDVLVTVSPVHRGYFYDGHGATGAFVLIGFFNEKPVYRTTHTVAHHMEGNRPGDFCIHWPPIFPNIHVPECGEHGQLDVTIRTELGPPLPNLEGDDDDDDDNNDYYYYYDDNNDYYYYDGGVHVVDYDDDRDDYYDDHDDYCSDFDYCDDFFDHYDNVYAWNVHDHHHHQQQQGDNFVINEDWIITDDINEWVGVLLGM